MVKVLDGIGRLLNN